MALLASVVLAYHSVRRYWRSDPSLAPADRLLEASDGADERQ